MDVVPFLLHYSTLRLLYLQPEMVSTTHRHSHLATNVTFHFTSDERGPITTNCAGQVIFCISSSHRVWATPMADPTIEDANSQDPPPIHSPPFQANARNQQDLLVLWVVAEVVSE